MRLREELSRGSVKLLLEISHASSEMKKLARADYDIQVKCDGQIRAQAPVDIAKHLMQIENRDIGAHAHAFLARVRAVSEIR